MGADGETTHLDTLEIERHGGNEDGDLEDGVEKDTSCGVEGKVSDSRHRDESTESEGDRLRCRTEQDRGTHPRESPRHTLFSCQIAGRRHLDVLVVCAFEEVVVVRVSADDLVPNATGGRSRGRRWTVEGVLAIELVDEDEDVVDSDCQNEEGDDLGDDERDFDSQQREEAHRRRDGEEDDDDTKESESELGVD